MYRSVDEVPARLRSRLGGTPPTGATRATILIADRRGREEIAKALQALPAASSTPPGAHDPRRDPPRDRPGLARPPSLAAKAVLAVLLGLALALIAVAFSRR